MNRRGEGGPAPFRGGRFFTIGHRWYVATRSDRDLGPLASRDRARVILAQYLSGLAVSNIEEGDASPVTGSTDSARMVSELSLFLHRGGPHGRDRLGQFSQTSEAAPDLNIRTSTMSCWRPAWYPTVSWFVAR